MDEIFTLVHITTAFLKTFKGQFGCALNDSLPKHVAEKADNTFRRRVHLKSLEAGMRGLENDINTTILLRRK